MTEQRDNKVPQIRFRGFEGEWVEIPMRKLLSFKNGYNAPKSQYGKGEKFINVLDIILNDYIAYDRIIGKVSIGPKAFTNYEVVFGDILFQRSSETREEVGQANVYLDRNKTATFGGFVIRGRPLVDFNSVFLNAALKSSRARKEITSRSGGSTRYNIGQESLEAAVLNLAPKLGEQGKIADLVMSLDRMIWLHQRKHGKLVTLKQAMLQKMFPQNGATTPEIRFKGFSGDWVEKALGDIAEIYQPKTISQYDLTETGFLVYGANGIIGRYSDYNHKREQVTVTCRGNTCGTVNFTKPNSWITGNAMVINIDANDLMDKEFLRSQLSFQDLDYLITGSGQPQITGVIKFHQVHVPEKVEQQKIGAYFRQLDSLISKHATQLEKLKQLKSACLEKMFV